jgi:hypothetical protein
MVDQGDSLRSEGGNHASTSATSKTCRAKGDTGGKIGACGSGSFCFRQDDDAGISVQNKFRDLAVVFLKPDRVEPELVALALGEPTFGGFPMMVQDDTLDGGLICAIAMFDGLLDSDSRALWDGIVDFHGLHGGIPGANETGSVSDRLGTGEFLGGLLSGLEWGHALRMDS